MVVLYVTLHLDHLDFLRDTILVNLMNMKNFKIFGIVLGVIILLLIIKAMFDNYSDSGWTVVAEKSFSCESGVEILLRQERKNIPGATILHTSSFSYDTPRTNREFDLAYAFPQHVVSPDDLVIRKLDGFVFSKETTNLYVDKREFTVEEFNEVADCIVDNIVPIEDELESHVALENNDAGYEEQAFQPINSIIYGSYTTINAEASSLDMYFECPDPSQYLKIAPDGRVAFSDDYSESKSYRGAENEYLSEMTLTENATDIYPIFHPGSTFDKHLKSLDECEYEGKNFFEIYKDITPSVIAGKIED